MTHIKEQDSPLTVRVKIRFDETYQFAAGSANVSVTTFLSSLQKLLKNERPLDITFLTGRIKEQDGLVNVPVKIRFDETYQFAAGSANVFITRFAERFENSEGRLTSDIDTTTDRSEDRTSNNESLIKRI